MEACNDGNVDRDEIDSTVKRHQSTPSRSTSRHNDVATSLLVAKQLREDNMKLGASFEAIQSKSSQSHLKELHSASEERMCENLYSIKDVGNECLQRDGQLKTQTQHVQFGKVNPEMVSSRDVELLRLRLIEQLEAPHRIQVKSLQQDLSKFQEMYLQEHRDLELLKSRMTEERKDEEKVFEKEMEKQRQLNEQLKLKNENLQKLVDDISQDIKFREMEKEIIQLKVSLRQACEEWEQYRKSEEDAVIACGKMEALQLRSSKEGEGKYQVMEKEVQAERRKNKELQAELVERNNTISALQQKVVELEERKLSCDEKTKSKESQLRSELGNLTTEFEEAKAEWEAQQLRLESQLNIAKKQFEEEALLSTKRLDEISRLKSEHLNKIKQTEEMEMKKLIDFQDEYNELEKTLEDSRIAASEASNSFQEEIDALKHELSTQRASIATLHSEKEDILGKMHQSSKELIEAKANAKLRIAEFQDLTEEYQNLQSKYREVSQKEHQLCCAKDKLEAKIEMTQNENESLSREIEDERQLYHQNMQKVQNDFRSEVSSLSQRNEALQIQLTFVNESYKQNLTQLKKDKLRYKKLCVRLKSGSTESAREMDKVQEIIKIEMESKIDEIAGLKSQITEMKKQKEAKQD